MTTRYETAYRTLNPAISDRDLKRLYTPTTKEQTLLNGIASKKWANLALTIHYKVFQYLGYFVLLKDVPERIKLHVAESLGFKRLPTEDRLESYDRGPSKRGHFEKIRKAQNVQPFSPARQSAWLEGMARQAALTKHDVAGIINQLLDELVRQRYEIPVFSLLQRVAEQARKEVHDQFLSDIASRLTDDAKTTIDALLKRGNDPLTGWNSLKREPKRPTNREVRFWLAHLERLKRLADQLPALDVPAQKMRFFRNWARAYDAAQLSRLKASTRYGLAAIFIQSQRGEALDGAVDLYLRFIQQMENTAIRKHQAHRLEAGSGVDDLISQLLKTTIAAKADGSAEDQVRAIDASYPLGKDAIIEACQRHLRVRHQDFLPFLIEPYQGLRTPLLNCLEIAEPQAKDDNRVTPRLLAALQAVRKLRKQNIIELKAVGLTRGDLAWLPALWRSHVFVPDSSDGDVDRAYLELAIHFRLRAELKAGELYVPQGERYEDYRERLVDDERLAKELPAYGETTCIETQPTALVAKLRKDLAARIVQVDERFPKNQHAEIVNGKLSLSRTKKKDSLPEVKALEALVSERMVDANISDVMVDTCRWVNLASEFRTVKEEKGRLKDLPLRIVISLICYGLNIGPTQTARSVRLVSRKQVSWVNEQYVTEETLDRAIVRVINRFDLYQLPRYWGSGKSASADGTKWSVYEQNLISERHIRYGGYGGIGYYHVSDRYIALMSCFTTCGTYEAVHILDGLLENQSDIQPDTLHGDSQAQNLPVFALSFLLGIKLMPRIRQIGKLVFSRAEKKRCSHMEPLFDKDPIDWKVIEEQLPEMMRVAVSIKVGQVSSSEVLRRLGKWSKKNALYLGFLELGRVIRTMFLLKYIDDYELRRTISATTNKSEQFNSFLKLVFYGGEGAIQENLRHEQTKMVKWGHLAANLVILHNVNQMTRILTQLEQEGYELTPAALAGISPFRLGHLNRMGILMVDGNRDPEASFASVELHAPLPAAA